MGSYEGGSENHRNTLYEILKEQIKKREREKIKSYQKL